MPLPSLENQTPTINTFTTLFSIPDKKPIFRVKLKRRSVSGTTDVFDATWTTITQYVNDLGTVQAGVDDQTWIQGVTRVSALNLVVDNSTGKFNSSADTHSLWYNSATSYYQANSIVEVDIGFELMTGTQYYSTKPYHTGVIRLDDIKHNIQDNTTNLGIMSLWDWLRSVPMSSIINFKRTFSGNLVSITDKLFAYVENLSIGVTRGACSPRYNVTYKDVNKELPSSLIETACKNGGNIYGMNRSKELFLTYFDNPYYISTYGTLANSSCVLYYQFNSNTGADPTSSVLNLGTEVGAGTVLSFSVSYTGTSFGTNKFNAPQETRKYTNYIENTSVTMPLQTNLFSASQLTTVDMPKTVEAVFKINKVGNGGSLQSPYGGWGTFFEFLVGTGSSYNYFVSAGYVGSNHSYLAFSGTIPVGNISVTVSFSEDQWYHLTATWSGTSSSDTINHYVNGERLYSVPFNLALTGSTWATYVVAGKQRTGAIDVEFDTVRVFTRAFTDTEARISANETFGNKISWSLSSVYTLSNSKYSDITSYTNGETKVINRVVVGKSGYSITKAAEFTLPPSTTARLTVFVGDAEFTTQSLSSAAAVKQACIITKDWWATETATNYFRVGYTDTQDDQACAPSVFIGYLSGTGYHMPSGGYISTTYASSQFFAVFLPEVQASQYVFENTASVQQYGARDYVLDINTKLTSFKEYSNLATGLLASAATPKIRMSISVPFIEGDLDLFDKVTVTFSPDKSDAGVEYDVSDWESDVIVSAGNVTWTSKEFWVIGYAHNFNEQETEYVLREV